MTSCDAWGFHLSTPPWDDARKLNGCWKRLARSIRTFRARSLLAMRGSAMADEAFEWLDRALQERDGGVLEVRAGPLFQPLRQDPRFVPLLQRIGLSDEQVEALDFDIELPPAAGASKAGSGRELTGH